MGSNIFFVETDHDKSIKVSNKKISYNNVQTMPRRNIKIIFLNCSNNKLIL